MALVFMIMIVEEARQQATQTRSCLGRAMACRPRDAASGDVCMCAARLTLARALEGSWNSRIAYRLSGRVRVCSGCCFLSVSKNEYSTILVRRESVSRVRVVRSGTRGVGVRENIDALAL